MPATLTYPALLVVFSHFLCLSLFASGLTCTPALDVDLAVVCNARPVNHLNRQRASSSSIPFPSGTCVAVEVHICGFLLVTPREDTYILPFTNVQQKATPTSWSATVSLYMGIR